jgi:hypothetical protein
VDIRGKWIFVEVERRWVFGWRWIVLRFRIREPWPDIQPKIDISSG